MDGPQGKALSLYIETPTSAADTAMTSREAKDLVALYGDAPQFASIQGASVGICRTQGCLEMREMPHEMYLFRKQPDGSWKSVPRVPR